MDNELTQWMLLASIIVAGLVVCVATWLPRQKRAADWFMVAGATMSPLGMIGLTILFDVLQLYSYPYEWISVLCYGLLAGGALLFAMGFVMDRASRRREQDYQKIQTLVQQPPPH